MNGFVGRDIAAIAVAVGMLFAFTADARTYRIDGTTRDEGWRIIGKYRVTEERELQMPDIAAGQRRAILDAQPRRDAASEVLRNYANRRSNRSSSASVRQSIARIDRIADEIVDNRVKHRKRITELEAKTSVLKDCIAFKKLCPGVSRRQLVAYLLDQGYSASVIQYAMNELDAAARIADINTSKLVKAIKDKDLQGVASAMTALGAPPERIRAVLKVLSIPKR